MKKTVWFFLSLVLVVMFNGCDNRQEHKPVRIGMPVWPGYEPLHIAAEKGLNGHTDVSITMLPTTSDTKAAFKNGIVDVAALTLDEVLHLAQDMDDIRVILVTDISDGGDAILGQEGITSVSQLKGRVLGLEPNALSSYLLSRAVEKNNGVDLDDIIISPMGADTHERAFLEKKVDALVTYEPLKTFLVGKGGRVLFDSSMIKNEIIDVLVVRESVAKTMEAQLEEIVSGWFKALLFIKKKEQESIALMAKNEGVGTEEFLKILKGLHVPGLEENRHLFEANGKHLNETAQKVKRFMEEKRIVTKAVDTGAMFNGRYLPREGSR